MTSKKSSHDVFSFTLKDTAKGNVLISMIVFIPAMVMLFGDFFLNEVFSVGTPFRPFTGSYAYEITEMNAGYFAIMILWSCLFALKTFSFLSSKKECNVYFSLGITRDKLFYSKYLGGALGIIGTLTAYYAFDFLFNWLRNGFMLEGATVWAFYYISTLVTCLAAYTVAVYAFVNAGNIVEGIVFTFFFGIFWPVFNAVVNQAMSILVYGNAYGTRMHSGVYEFSSDIWFMDIFGSYTEQFDKYTWRNDLLSKRVIAANGFDAPDWSGIIFAAVIVVIIVFMSGRMFRKRTSEICGFVFRSKNLYKTFFTLLGVCMGLSLVGVMSMDRIGAALVSFLIAIIFIIVGWFICERRIPVRLTVALAVLGVAFLGGCIIGYGDDVPEKSKIKSVDISIDFSYLQDADPCGYILNYGQWGVSYRGETAVYADFMERNYNIDYTTLTSENDIDWILDLHSTIIKEGYRNKADSETARDLISIAYLMEDGSVIVRDYSYMGPESHKKLLGFSQTDNGKALMEVALRDYSENADYFNPPESAANRKIGSNLYFGIFSYSNWMENVLEVLKNRVPSGYYKGENTTAAALADKDLSFVGMIECTKNESLLANRFFKALFTDLSNQTAEQRYLHSAEDEIGAILVPLETRNTGFVAYCEALEDFSKLKESDAYYGDFPAFYDKRMNSYVVEDEDYYDEPSVGFDTQSAVDEYEDIISPTFEENPEKLIRRVVKKGNIGEFFHIYVITKDMTNTIDYLKEVGLYDKLMKEEEQPVGVRIDTTENVYSYFNNATERFRTSAINPDFSTYNYNLFSEYLVDIFSTEKITDAKTIDYLYDNSVMYSGKVQGGYIAEFFYADGKQVSRFVPASAITEEILSQIKPLQ